MTFKGRLIGLDLGRARIGVAVSDQEQTVATGVCSLSRSGDRAADHAGIAELVAEYEAGGVVVGVPYSLSGAVGPAAAAALDEVAALSGALAVPVATVDERLTTVAAAGSLRAGGRRSKQQRAVIDQTAAAVILQSWLDSSRARQEAR